jgi:prophage maintenance system killer protein
MFLNENGYALTTTNDELADFTLGLASSEPPMPPAEIAAWLRRNTKRNENQ